MLVNFLMAWMIDEQPWAAKPLEADASRDACIVNVLQAVTNVAEYPPCREQLQQLKAGSLLSSVQHQLPDGRMPSEMVRQAAGQATRLIRFHTWPQ